MRRRSIITPVSSNSSKNWISSPLSSAGFFFNGGPLIKPTARRQVRPVLRAALAAGSNAGWAEKPNTGL
jgi:hypothetical protein